MRVARDFGDLPSLVPGLLPLPHWQILKHGLPTDDSLLGISLPSNIHALPKEWAESLAACYDMIWVTSNAAKDELVQARIAPRRVQVWY